MCRARLPLLRPGETRPEVNNILRGQHGMRPFREPWLPTSLHMKDIPSTDRTLGATVGVFMRATRRQDVSLITSGPRSFHQPASPGGRTEITCRRNGTLKLGDLTNSRAVVLRGIQFPRYATDARVCATNFILRLYTWTEEYLCKSQKHVVGSRSITKFAC